MVSYPPTYAGRREWVTGMHAADVRARCGIPQQAIATALGVTDVSVSKWERGLVVPTGRAGDAYCRVVAGLARHLEVPDG